MNLMKRWMLIFQTFNLKFKIFFSKIFYLVQLFCETGLEINEKSQGLAWFNHY